MTELVSVLEATWPRLVFGLASLNSIYLFALVYFWLQWGLKYVLSRFYRPWDNSFTAAVTVVIPTYKEERAVLAECVNRVLNHSPEVVAKVLIVTDVREPQTTQWCREQWPTSRVQVIAAPPGKRQAVRLGVESATTELLVIVESDTFAKPGAINALLKPFADARVGGAVGDQLIYRPYQSVVHVYNNWVELIKYRLTIPALSLFGQVTVLGGRCVAFRRQAVLSLMDSLTDEVFLGKRCVSGDDGRLTSLLLQAGWRCVYQGSAIFLTVSPPTIALLCKQRLRWFRNACRRTLRALFCIRERYLPEADRFWVWRRPLAAAQMVTVWSNSAVMGSVLFMTIKRITTGEWLLTGLQPHHAIVLFVLLLIGMSARRLLRLLPAIGKTKVASWVYVLTFPWYLTVMWFIRLYAMASMNKQGWITRMDSGAGGFGLTVAPAVSPNWRPLILRHAPALAAIAIVVTGTTAGAMVYKANTKSSLQKTLLATQLQPLSKLTKPSASQTPRSDFRRHVVKSGETVAAIARQYNVPADHLWSFNEALLPSLKHMQVGLVLTIPPENAATPSQSAYSYVHQQPSPLRTTYVPETNTLEVRGRGQHVTLSRLRRLAGRQLIREVAPAEWEIEATVVLKAGVSLHVSNEEVTRLKLISTPGKFVALIAEDGQIIIEGVHITSWDNTRQQIDDVLSDGRSYLAAKGQARLDIFDSELAYLGYDAGPPAVATQGVSYFVPDSERGKSLAAGEVKGSRFHHNHHGIYLSGTSAVSIETSVFSNNEDYGVDIFGGSRGIRVVDNRVYKSGQHGIVLAQDADENYVADNLVLANDQHGIVAHEGSDSNVIENNRVEDNHDGIVIQRSDNNVLRQNVIVRHTRGIRVTHAAQNLLLKNTIADSRRAAIYLDTTPDEITYGEKNTLLGDSSAQRLHVDIL